MIFSFRDGLFGSADIKDPSMLAKNLTTLSGTEKVDIGSRYGTEGALPFAQKILILFLLQRWVLYSSSLIS